MKKYAEDGCEKSAICRGRKFSTAHAEGLLFCWSRPAIAVGSRTLVGGVTPSVNCMLGQQQLHSAEVKPKGTERRI